MTHTEFSALTGENILFRSLPNRKWYIYSWKIISGVFFIIILTVIANSLLAGRLESLLSSFLGSMVSGLFSKLIFFGLIPLGGAAWVMDDLVSTYMGEFVLTNQRIWIKGSPHAWSSSSTPLDDVTSLVWRRDAIFIRQKSTHKIQVHMFSDGKLFAKAYQDFVHG